MIMSKYRIEQYKVVYVEKEVRGREGEREGERNDVVRKNERVEWNREFIRI